MTAFRAEPGTWRQHDAAVGARSRQLGAALQAEAGLIGIVVPASRARHQRPPPQPGSGDVLGLHSPICLAQAHPLPAHEHAGTPRSAPRSVKPGYQFRRRLAAPLARAPASRALPWDARLGRTPEHPPHGAVIWHGVTTIGKEQRVRLARSRLSSSRSPRPNRPAGIAARWLRQPRRGNHAPGFGAYEGTGRDSTLPAIGGDTPGWKFFPGVAADLSPTMDARSLRDGPGSCCRWRDSIV